MSWFRLNVDYHADGRIRKAKAVKWWPLILAAFKRGDGVAARDDLDPEVLADLNQGCVEDAARAVEALKRSGVIEDHPEGYTTANWTDYQPDPTAAARQARRRERNRQVAVIAEKAVSDLEERHAASRDVTVTGRDVTVTHARQDRTGHTEQDIQPGQQRALFAHTKARESTRARATLADVRSATGGKTVPELCEAWWLTQDGAHLGVMRPNDEDTRIFNLALKHTADRVCWAIIRAKEIADERGDKEPGSGLLAKLCAEGPRTTAPPGAARTSAAYRAPEGVTVAQPKREKW